MKKKLWIPIVAFLFGGLLSMFVFGQETPVPPPVFVDVNQVPWADPNLVSGKVLPITMLSDELVRIRCRETAPGVVTEYTLVGSVPSGVALDVNTPNEARIEFVPAGEGVYYISMDAKVVSPYEGRPVRQTMAINVLPILLPSLEWFYEKVQNQPSN